MNKTEQLLAKAYELGFPVSGIIPARRPATLDQFYRWLDEGKNADMRYLANRREAYAHPSCVLEGVRSLVVLAWPYIEKTPHGYRTPGGKASRNNLFSAFELGDTENRRLGTVAPYAAGRDYHNVLREKLKELGLMHRNLFPNDRCRGCVDTAPLLEKDAAATAGLGSFGRNACFYCGEWGSRVCLAVLLSTAELDLLRYDGAQFRAIPETPSPKGSECKDCQICLKACPTQALSDSGLDGRRCLNYWLIECKGEIPEEIQSKAGSRLFGCDVCQQVCPRNKPLEPIYLNPETVLELTSEAFKEFFSDSPLSRCGLEGLQRNAQIVLNNMPPVIPEPAQRI